MNYVIRGLIGASLLLPATAAAAAPAPGVNCANPSRDSSVDYREYAKACSARAARAARAANTEDSGDPTVLGQRTSLTAADFSAVPTWTDAQIQAQFAATRDARYLYGDDHPSMVRRLSWLYPDDGCYTRAEQVSDLATDAGLPKPYKLFAFGPLSVKTDTGYDPDPQHPYRHVDWWYHVVPVVKNSAGQPIVLDAAINPCAPMPWKDWLAKMVPDITIFNDVSNPSDYRGVTVADDASYYPSSLKLNDPSGRGPTPVANETISFDDQESYFLGQEWNREIEISRDPNLWLGASSPWLNACPVACSAATATDMGAQHSVTTVKGNGCLKITQSPGAWAKSQVIQAQGNGTGYPIPYTWTNCTSNGSNVITGNWTQTTMRPISNTCTTVISLTGSSSASVKLTWWANG